MILIQATGELSLLKITIAIALVSWMGTARIVRAECLRLMNSDFIRAALAAGAGRLWLVSRHLLPNIAAPLLVVLTVSVGQAIILEATLSFLNLGVPATVPSWGNLLGNGLSAALNGAWWSVLFPGLMIVVAVLSVNLIGDGLSDIADPRNRMRKHHDPSRRSERGYVAACLLAVDGVSALGEGESLVSSGERFWQEHAGGTVLVCSMPLPVSPG